MTHDKGLIELRLDALVLPATVAGRAGARHLPAPAGGPIPGRCLCCSSSVRRLRQEEGAQPAADPFQSISSEQLPRTCYFRGAPRAPEQGIATCYGHPQDETPGRVEHLPAGRPVAVATPTRFSICPSRWGICPTAGQFMVLTCPLNNFDGQPPFLLESLNALRAVLASFAPVQESLRHGADDA
jgi:hypothetical protein